MSEYDGLELNPDEIEEVEDLYLELRKCYRAGDTPNVIFAALTMCLEEIEEAEKDFFDKQSTFGLNGYEY